MWFGPRTLSFRSNGRLPLLALFGCNAFLGIEEAQLACGACGEGLTCIQGSCVASSSSASGSAGAAAPDPDAGLDIDSGPCDRPGVSYCVGKRRVRCASNRTVEHSAECASQGHCEQAAMGSDCAPCVPTCQGNLLSACRDGVSLAPRDCGADFCDISGGGDCLPAACASGDSACANGQFLRCDNGASFTVAATCASAALCSTAEGGCLEPVCAVGEKRCTAAMLEVCVDDRSNWVSSEQCSSAALCDSLAGACLPPACSADDAQCTGATLRSCNPDRTAFTEQTCESPDLCDSRAGVCQRPTCELGMGRCEGGVLFRCEGDPPRFERIDTCDEAALCDAAGVQCRACVPSSQRCSNDGRAAISCDPTGLSETVVVCEMLLGLLGRCVDGACAVL
jgi:hypothetical protein